MTRALPPAGPRTRVALWGAATFAFTLASTFVIRPVRDALVLDGDPDLLPALFSATFGATLALQPAWGAVLARVARRRFVPIAFYAFGVALVGFAAAVRLDLDPVLVGRVFYVFSAVANLFLVSLFWSVCADVLGPEAARRLYGPISAGGTVGAVVGPFVTKALVAWLAIGVAGVLVASAVMLVLALVAYQRFDAAARELADTTDAASDRAVAGGKLDGLRDVARSPYLGGIGLYVVLTACASTFVYLEQANIVRAALPDRAARTELFATIDLWTNLGVFAVQTVLAGPLLAWLGVGGVLALLPAIQGAGLCALTAAPTLAMSIAVSVASRTAQHGLTRPARELLFTVVSRDQKYRAKNAIDTFLFRGGDVGSAWLRQGLLAAGLGGAGLVAVMLPLTGVWIAASVLLGAGFRRRRATPAAP